jgi:hypothetical protein
VEGDGGTTSPAMMRAYSGLPADDLRIVGVARRFERAEFFQRFEDHARAGFGFEPSVLGR